MRIAFMGTPEFAVPSLKMLIEQGHEIEVFTQPDRPRDRGHGLAMPPVKAAALEAGEQSGVKAMETSGKKFDTEFHEAVAMVPATDEKMKGCILDTVEKGYMYNDKVLRHAKVVVCQ